MFLSTRVAESRTSVIGALLRSSSVADEAFDQLAPTDFIVPAHQTGFEGTHRLYNRGQPIDTVTVADRLHRSSLLKAAHRITELAGDLTPKWTPPPGRTNHGRCRRSEDLRGSRPPTRSTISRVGTPRTHRNRRPRHLRHPHRPRRRRPQTRRPPTLHPRGRSRPPRHGQNALAMNIASFPAQPGGVTSRTVKLLSL